MLFVERCLFEFATVVSRSVAGNGLVTLQWPILLLNQPDVAVKAIPTGGASRLSGRGPYHYWCHWPSFWPPEKGTIPCIWGPSCWALPDLSWPSVEFTQIKDMPCNTGGLLLGGCQQIAQLDYLRLVVSDLPQMLRLLVHFLQAQGPGPFAEVYQHHGRVGQTAGKSPGRQDTGLQHWLQAVCQLFHHIFLFSLHWLKLGPHYVLQNYVVTSYFMSLPLHAFYSLDSLLLTGIFKTENHILLFKCYISSRCIILAIV